MVFRRVPIEYGGDVGCGDVFQTIAEELYRNVPQNLFAGGARDGECVAIKAQLRKIYDVLA
jgi:hypothetical protein